MTYNLRRRKYIPPWLLYVSLSLSSALVLSVNMKEVDDNFICLDNNFIWLVLC
jgi:hypothetical protein